MGLLLCVGAVIGGQEAAEIGGAEPPFTGSERCAGCHPKETRAWRESPHGRHAIPADASPKEAEGAVGSRWMQAYFRRDENGYNRILARCYDHRTGGYLDVQEVLEAIRGSTLPESPTGPPPLDRRSFDLDCSGCHASQARPQIVDGKMATHWTDLSINCETCHGPGLEHARAWEALSAKAPMVRLEKLDLRASTAVCARCHGGPPTVGDFAPSDASRHIGLLADRDGLFPDGTASGQVYQHAAFLRSPCHTEGALTCNDCHEAHGPGLRHQQHADAICTRCHEDYASRAHTFHAADKEGARCIGCHMPRNLGGLMAHQRDHRIGIPLPASPHVPDACTSCHKDKDKAWADKAYRESWGAPPRADLDAIEGIVRARRRDPSAEPLLRRALHHKDPFYRANAAVYLRELDSIMDDPDPAVRLVALEASTQSAVRLARMAQDSEPLIRGMALVYRARMGAPIGPGMRADLEVAARLVRDLPEAHVILGVFDLEAGEARRAAERFRMALAFRPEALEAWLELATAQERLGERDGALASHRRRATLLQRRLDRRPLDLDLVSATADAYLRGEQFEQARALLDRALKVAPAGASRDRVRALLRALAEQGG